MEQVGVTMKISRRIVPKGCQVDIVERGQPTFVVPTGKRWDDFFAAGPQVSGDFIAERVQPGAKGRERL